MTSSDVTPKETAPRTRTGVVLAVLIGGYFMAQVDLTVLAVALPTITRDLGADLVQGLWAVNAYAIALGAVLITSGRVGDLLGRRRVFAAGVAVFTLFSLVCGLAQDPLQLILARAGQGLGAGLLAPQVLAMIVALVPEERRGRALGVRSSVGAGAAVIGPVLGGLLVGFDWRWIFWINVPVGVVVLVLALTLVPDVRPQRRARLDLAGVVLSAPAVLAAVLALTLSEESGWTPGIWAVLGASAVLFGAFAVQQRRAQDRDPLVPFAVFRGGRFPLMCLAGMGVTVGLIGLTLVLSFYLQSGLRAGALAAGAVIAPASLTSMLLAPFVGRLADRINPRVLLLAGLVLTAAGLGWIVWTMGPGAAPASFVPAMVVVGLGNSMLFTPLTALATRGVAAAVAGAAAGVLATVLQLGAAIGSATVGAVMQGGGPIADTARTAMLIPLGAVLVAVAACLLVREPSPRRPEGSPG